MSSKPENQTPRLKETEYGYYIREKWRSKEKRTQKTHRFPKNLEKVILAQIGTLEVYVYPYRFPDQVFLGIYPVNAKLTKHQTPDLFRAHNTIRWYLDGKWTNPPGNHKQPNILRKRLIQAYINGERNQKELVERLKLKKRRKVPRRTPKRTPKQSSRTEATLENGASVLIK